MKGHGKGTMESNFGPPSRPRRGGGWYGHVKVGKATKRWRINQAHEAAWLENIQRELDRVNWDKVEVITRKKPAMGYVG